MWRETASGAQTDRAQLRKALAALDEGGVLLVTRLDRLARSTRDLLNVLAQITEREAGFQFLADAWTDTTTPHGRLMVTMLAGLAEFELDLIHARTSEGWKRAQDNGVKMGRPSKLDPLEQREAVKRLKSGESPRIVGRSYEFHRSTIERLQTNTVRPERD